MAQPFIDPAGVSLRETLPHATWQGGAVTPAMALDRSETLVPQWLPGG